MINYEDMCDKLNQFFNSAEAYIKDKQYGLASNCYSNALKKAEEYLPELIYPHDFKFLNRFTKRCKSRIDECLDKLLESENGK